MQFHLFIPKYIFSIILIYYLAYFFLKLFFLSFSFLSFYHHVSSGNKLYLLNSIDIFRAELGGDLCMVVLDIAEEEQMKRVKSRHGGDENMMELAKVIFDLSIFHRIGPLG